VLEFFAGFATEFAMTAFTALAFLLGRLIQNFIINRRYMLSGRYLSRFFDVVEGQNVIQKSEVLLRQSGKHISAVDKLSDARSWQLRGEVYRGGRVCGIYYAKSSNDAGVGSFFFQTKSDDLEGWWAGFDSANGSTTSGEYSLRRRIFPRIQRMKKAERSMALELIGQTQIGQLARSDLTAAKQIGDAALGDQTILEIRLLTCRTVGQHCYLHT